MSINKYLNKLIRLFYFTLALIIRNFTKVKKNQIFCYSYYGKMYSCNPRALSEYILRNNKNFTLVWGFNKNFDLSQVDKRIKVVHKYSIKYLYYLYTSKFIISNSRNILLDSLFIKKKGQKYIMTWHASFALKRVEKDAQEQLSSSYIKNAIKDSQMCDLMISNSKNSTSLIKNAFWYDGEILENCIPRNDIFYNKNLISITYERIRKEMNFTPDTKIVLYAPTFRSDGSLNYYNLNWNLILSQIKKSFNFHNVEILVRLHPNLADKKGINDLIQFPHVHNITSAPSITDFLFAADIMISDYTSAMFDFSILNRPCFIYATDIKEYDRGFYFKINELPFPIAENESSLISNFNNFNMKNYLSNLKSFNDNLWGLEEDGHGCERLFNWISNN